MNGTPDTNDEDRSPEGNGSHPVVEIPLFPLEVVLFPRMILPLHIFEERYKEMINRCVEESLPFGIVLVSGINDETGSVETHSIGCTARIASVERLQDGRMNIEVEGEERFRILDTHEQFSYRSALTEPYLDAPDDSPRLASLAGDVQRLLKDFLMRTLAQWGQEPREFDLPDDPRHLSFIAACVLPVSNEEKQSLLINRSIAERLSVEREALLQEVTRLRRLAETQEPVPMVWKRLKTGVYDEYLCSN